MAKKYLSKSQKEARLKKNLKICGIVFLILVVVAVAVGVTVSVIEDRKDKISYELLRETLLSDYEKDPWDGKDPDTAKEKEGELWAIFEGLLRIEDDGMENGSKGVEFDPLSGDTLCFDLSKIENEALKVSLENMLSDYAERKRKTPAFASYDELKAQGKIDTSSGGAYTDGCLCQILNAGWDKENELYRVKIYFYYTSTFGKGADIFVARKDYFEAHKEDYFESWEPVSDDGKWVSYIANTMIA